MEPFFLYDEEFDTREKELNKIIDFSLKKNYNNKNTLFLKKLIYSAILHNKPKINIKTKQVKTNILKNPQISNLIKNHLQDRKNMFMQFHNKQIHLNNRQEVKKFPIQTNKPIENTQRPNIYKPNLNILSIPIAHDKPEIEIPRPSFAKQNITVPKPEIIRKEIPTTRSEIKPNLIKQEIEIPKFEDVIQEDLNPVPPRIEEPSLLDHNITKNPDNSLIYIIKELTIDPKTYRVFYALQNKLFSIIEKAPNLIDDIDFFSKNLKETLKLLNMNIQDIDTENLKLYLKNYILGFHKLQQLILDGSIKTIYCYGANQPIIIDHTKYGKIQTNLNFNSNTELDDFIKYMAKKAGKVISSMSPIINVSFPNGIKFEATIGGDFASSKFILIK